MRKFENGVDKCTACGTGHCLEVLDLSRKVLVSRDKIRRRLLVVEKKVAQGVERRGKLYAELGDAKLKLS